MRSKDLPVKTGGVKHDHGKPRPDLIFSAMARALLEVSKVAAMGAAKYDDDNWLIVEDASKRYRDAKGRHLLLGAIEPHDNESNITHLAHEAWNALAVLELHLRQLEEPKKPIENWPESAEARSLQIMQNGNDGEHYRDVLIGKRAGGGIIIGFEGDDAIIMSECDLGGMSWGEAVKACKVLEHNGHDDWFLPSKDQLNLAWLNHEKLDGFRLEGWCWSASQLSTFNAWIQRFSDGYQGNGSKSYTDRRVRPVRSVNIENLELESQPPGDE